MWFQPARRSSGPDAGNARPGLSCGRCDSGMAVEGRKTPAGRRCGELARVDPRRNATRLRMCTLSRISQAGPLLRSGSISIRACSNRWMGAAFKKGGGNRSPTCRAPWIGFRGTGRMGAHGRDSGDFRSASNGADDLRAFAGQRWRGWNQHGDQAKLLFEHSAKDGRPVVGLGGGGNSYVLRSTLRL